MGGGATSISNEPLRGKSSSKFVYNLWDLISQIIEPPPPASTAEGRGRGVLIRDPAVRSVADSLGHAALLSTPCAGRNKVGKSPQKSN